jgi:predicted KAP-like P-loop ATPase
MMSEFYNDRPIDDIAGDRYGMAPFAKTIAKLILDMKAPVGTAIALTGAWGSGKSSVVNMIKQELCGADENKLVISDFKCWWFRGEEALALAFLQNLNATLRNKLGDKVKDLVPEITRGVLQAGPIVGAATALTPAATFGALFGGLASFSKRFFPDGDPLEKTFKKLEKVLQEQDTRFLFVIDDIDRLRPEETLAIFRLVKSVGNLPNVMFLLVFDRQLGEKVVQERYPSEGPHFLEKIIQIGFELPLPMQSDLNDAVLGFVEEICGPTAETDQTRIMNSFYDVVVPYIATPRHMVRLQNAISVTWPAIASEISMADFLALETLRLYEPELFLAIRRNRDRLLGARSEGDPESSDEARFSPFLRGIDADRHETAKTALQRLFPRLEEMGYGAESESGWNMERRVCVEQHFDTYFRLSLGEGALPIAQIGDLTKRAGQPDFIDPAFRRAAATIRRNGKSMVPVYLDELTTHAQRVDRESVLPLLIKLFEIFDEINLERDDERGFFAVANTTLRYHWLIRRLTDQRFTIKERTELYLSALESASLGWLVDFTRSAWGDYHNRSDGPKREEDCLITEEALPELVERALSEIRLAAQAGTLIEHPNLLSILCRWRDFCDNDATEARAWTDRLLNDDRALVILAKRFTGESWSHSAGMYGLGDRVAQSKVEAQIEEDIDIIDAGAFKEGLERIQKEEKLDDPSRDIVKTFLDAWADKRSGKSD